MRWKFILNLTFDNATKIKAATIDKQWQFICSQEPFKLKINPGYQYTRIRSTYIEFMKST
jgi:hypothetical protein